MVKVQSESESNLRNCIQIIMSTLTLIKNMNTVWNQVLGSEGFTRWLVGTNSVRCKRAWGHKTKISVPAVCKKFKQIEL